MKENRQKEALQRTLGAGTGSRDHLIEPRSGLIQTTHLRRQFCSFEIFCHCFKPNFMSSYQVRPATVRDAKAIAQIHVTAALAACKGALPDDPINTASVEKRLAYGREAIEYSEPQVQVVCLGEEVVGFVGFDRSRDKGTPSTTGEIWALYVLPAHWDQGAGVALWDAANDGLKEEGCTRVTVWVPLRNARALRFVELAGFKREMTSLKTVALGTQKIEEIRLKRSVA